MVISKDKARMIAIQLCEKQKKYAELLQTNFEKAVYDAYIKQTPVAVKNIIKKYPEWIQTTSSICLEGHGFSFMYVPVKKHVIEQGNGRAFLKLDPSLASVLKKKHNEAIKQQNEYRQLCTDVKNTILALKTEARITEKFPEAAKLIPKPVTNAIIINVDDVRNKLKMGIK